MKLDLLKIKPCFPVPATSKLDFEFYVTSMERLLKKVIPDSIFEMDETSKFVPYETHFQKLNLSLPLIDAVIGKTAPCSLAITTPFAAYNTQGATHFLFNALFRYLAP